MNGDGLDWKRVKRPLITDLHSKMMIRDVHIADRPRERLMTQGAGSLSNQELIAILLRTGTKEESVLVLANRVLSSFDKIQDLRDATIEELTSVKGIGKRRPFKFLRRRKSENGCIESIQKDDIQFVHQKMQQLI